MKWKVTCCVFEVDDGACLKDAVSRLDVACRPPLTDFGTNKPNVDFADFFWSATGAGRAGPAQPSPAPLTHSRTVLAGLAAVQHGSELASPQGNAAGLIQLCGSLNLGEKKRASGLTPVAGPFMGGLHVLAALRSPRVSSRCPKTSGCWIGKIGNRSYVINSFFLTTGDFVYLLPLELEKPLASFHV